MTSVKYQDGLDPRSELVRYGFRAMGAVSLSVSDGNFNLVRQFERHWAQGSSSAALFPYSVFQFLWIHKEQKVIKRSILENALYYLGAFKAAGS